MSELLNFRNKTLREIRIWAWVAAVAPLTALAGIFFVWTFGTDSLVSKAFIIGETTVFGVAVIWWWWAMYVIRKIVKSWGTTNQSIKEVLEEVKEVRAIVRKTIADDK